ncbi:MAG TPA: hypothetical protein PK022_08600 [Syntrophales bacterium]|nr:hypothetical protein [Syntrophales bacterium]
MQKRMIFKELLLSEIDIVITEMSKTQSLDEKIYFFSAVHSTAQRIMNLDFSNDLLYMHSILQYAYQSFFSRLQAIKAGETTIPFTEEQVDRLDYLLRDLVDCLTEGKSVDAVMKEFVKLAYSTTGNGYYLMKKGALKL